MGWPVAEQDGRLLVAADPWRASCAFSWSGPVRLPLASEADVQAACGIWHVHGRRYGGPTPLGVDCAGAAAGVLGALGTLAALWAAGRDGRAVHVRTSVAQAALLLVGQYLAAASTDDDWREPVVPGGPPFTSADGVRFEIETLQAEPWQRFWAGLRVGRREIADGWRPFQQRFATASCPLPPALPRAAARRGYTELRALARDCGVELTAVAARPEADRSEADRPEADRSEADGPGAGGPGLPWRLGPTGPGAAGGTGTVGGADELPLRGVTVVEVTRRVQGPLAGHLLRLLGARVVRIEPPGGDPMRGAPPVAGDCSARFTALNRGKRVLEADLRSTAGRAVVREQVARSQVFLHSLAPGKDREYGLDPERLSALRPGLVHVSASGWGAERGPCPPVGTDYPVQAYSGLAALLTPPGLPATPSLLTVTDVLGGLVCAEGAVAGLLAGQRSGQGQRVESSLLSAARLLCAPGLRSGARPVTPGVPISTDLADLAADPRFAAALHHDRCALVRSPWEFTR
ncbi:CoA transferase [Streptacidiphilus sp. P02-A3a]|nr:CoA transferase [Streptacidiphilus sp. P02-A3a]